MAATLATTPPMRISALADREVSCERLRVSFPQGHETLAAGGHHVAVLLSRLKLRRAFPGQAVVVGKNQPRARAAVDADDDAVLQRDQARAGAPVGDADRGGPGLAIV